MKKQLIIGVVLYQPTENTIARIRKIAHSGYKIILFDNSLIETIIFQNTKNVLYFHSKFNVGLSGGIDFIAKKANDLNYYAFLNFDQDTIFTLKTLNFIEEVINEFILTNKFGNKLLAVGFRDIKKTDTKQSISIQNMSYNTSDVYFTINSGSLYMLKYYNKFKWFDEKFFVDGLDYNFCLQSDKYGFKIVEIYETPDLNHTIEQDDSILNIFNFKIKGRKYSFRRNTDFIISHTKLIFMSIVNLQNRHFIFLLKSLSVYCITQLLFYIKKITSRISF